MKKNAQKVFRFVFEGAGAFIFLSLIMWNLTTIKDLDFRAPFFESAIRGLHLYQRWDMFAPYPKKDNVWLEVPGTLADGTKLDLLTGSKDIYAIGDKAFYEHIPNDQWRKFYLNLTDRKDYAKLLGDYLCRRWNHRKLRFVESTLLKKVVVNVFSQVNASSGDKGGISLKYSWSQSCDKYQ